MEFLECVKGRRSIRKFEDKKVDHSVMEAVVAAAAYAPSWKNTQTARYLMVEDRKMMDELAENCVMGFEHNAEIIKNAPALVLLTSVTRRSGYERDGSFSTSKKDNWEAFDAGIAAQTFCLAAYEQGLGTVIMGIFDEEKTGAAVQLPEGQRVAAMIAVGYPAQAPEAPKRKTVEELLSFR